MRHIKEIMEEMGYIREYQAVTPKPTLANLLVLAVWDLVYFGIKWLLISLAFAFSIHVFLLATVQLFLDKAPQICQMIQH